jgi:hypothetical protein
MRTLLQKLVEWLPVLLSLVVVGLFEWWLGHHR